ncbi:thioesterase domain-containing protein [Streptomyces atratus]
MIRRARSACGSRCAACRRTRPWPHRPPSSPPAATTTRSTCCCPGGPAARDRACSACTRGAGIGWGCSGLLRHLPADRPICAIQARGLARDEELPSSVHEMADDYLDRIRSVQPSGPCHPAGWSLGGILAHMIATRLREAGEQAGLPAVLDTGPDVPSEGARGSRVRRTGRVGHAIGPQRPGRGPRPG